MNDNNKLPEKSQWNWVPQSHSVRLPEKSGWYWVLFDGYNFPTPCWFQLRNGQNEDPEKDSYFLPGGMGDSSSMGVYLDDIAKIGPEITVPEF